MWLFALLVGVPILEIALFIEVGGWLGLWPTLAIVVLTALAGTALLRSQGLGAMNELRRRLDKGGDPVGPIAHGAMILVAGVLLLTPGFFTDVVGFALLMPPVRAALIRFGAARLAAAASEGRVVVFSSSPRREPPRGGGPGDVIDGDYEPVEPDEDEERRGAGGSGWTRR
ncbi:MAG: FxsA family protein [Pseudomonadota bacterium]